MTFQDPDIFFSGRRNKIPALTDARFSKRVPRVTGAAASNVVITGTRFQAYIPARRQALRKAEQLGVSPDGLDFATVTYQEAGKEKTTKIPVKSENHRFQVFEAFRCLDRNAPVSEVKSLIKELK